MKYNRSFVILILFVVFLTKGYAQRYFNSELSIEGKISLDAHNFKVPLRCANVNNNQPVNQKTGGAETWTFVGTGTYTYSVFFYADEDESGNPIPFVDSGYEVYQSNSDPNIYKVSDWGDGVDFIFTWDKETNQCTVPEAFIGYTHPSYGDVSVADLPNWNSTKYTYEQFPCYYDVNKQTFHFPLIYYISGVGYFDYGYETLEVQWAYNMSYTLNDVTYVLRENKTAMVKTIAADRVDLVIPNSISYEGSTYTVTALGDSVFHNNVENNYLYSATFPSTITEVAEKAFWWYGPSAIVWNSNTKLPENSFDNWRYQSNNFLLYVNNANIAPSGVKNLVVDGIADEVILDEGYVFNCPKEFTAKKISYMHNYQMETGFEDCAGWETIALPFDVQTIIHETKGELVPFANYNNASNKKPFWLYRLSANGFVKATGISANTPYLISMPNNSNYAANYNVSGKVTFSATNVKVKQTSSAYWNTSTYDGATFYPCFSFYVQSATTYVLNVTNDYYTYSGIEKPGSVFINNYRYASPFEGRFYKSASNARALSIVFADENVTGIEEMLMDVTTLRKFAIYDLKGIHIRTVENESYDEAVKGLASGLYLINGKKVMIE